MRGDAELFEVLVYLTRDEAAELRDAAEALLQNFEDAGITPTSHRVITKSR